MKCIIGVAGYPLYMFRLKIVPSIVNQQPYQINAQTQRVVWLQNGTSIHLIPHGEAARGWRVNKLYYNVAYGKHFFDTTVRQMLCGADAEIEWRDVGFNPVDPPQWYYGG